MIASSPLYTSFPGLLADVEMCQPQCAVKCLRTCVCGGGRGGVMILICSIFQFPRCKCSHHGRFQVITVPSLNQELRRGMEPSAPESSSKQAPTQVVRLLPTYRSPCCRPLPPAPSRHASFDCHLDLRFLLIISVEAISSALVTV